MSRVKQEDREKTKKALLAAANYHFTQDGYDQAKTKAIAERAGIAEGTLFNYFPTKADLFLAVFAEQYVAQVSTVKVPKDLDAVASIMFCLTQTLSSFTALPKPLLITLAKVIATRAENFALLVQLDFAALETLTEQFQRRFDCGWLCENKDAQLWAEIVYSIAITECMLYIYDPDRTTEQLFASLQKKIAVVLGDKPLHKE